MKHTRSSPFLAVILAILALVVSACQVAPSTVSAPGSGFAGVKAQTRPTYRASESTATPDTGIGRATRFTTTAAGLGAPAIGQLAPNFSLVDLDGKAVRLSDFRGQSVVVNFFATWCGPCKAELPLLETASQTYRAQGLQVLLVDLEENPTSVRVFARALDLTMPIVVDPRGTVAAGQYALTNIPSTYFVDSGGTIRGVQYGPLTSTTLAANVRRVLTKTSSQAPTNAPAGCCPIS